MTTFRSEEMFVGTVSLGAVAWIIWIIRRGLRDRSLPIGRGHVRQRERPGAFGVLLAFYAASALLMLFIGLDLILGLEARSRL